MPELNLKAEFVPLRNGWITVTLFGFNPEQNIPDYEQEISLLVVKRSSDASLADWPAVSRDRFIKIRPVNPLRRGMNFTFELGPEAVNPIAYDNSGDYALKIKGQGNRIHSFAVSVRGFINSDTVYTSAVQTNHGANTAQTAAAEEAAAPATAATQNPFNNISVQEQNERRSRTTTGLSRIVAALCVLALLGVGAWFLYTNMFGSDEVTVAEEPAAEESTAEENAAQNTEPAQPAVPVFVQRKECSIAGANGLDDITLLKNCYSANPTNEEMLYFLKESLDSGRCEIALRILRSRARSDNGSVFSYIYASFADPQSPNSNACIEKSAEDAAYWRNRLSFDKNFNAADAEAVLQFLVQNTGAGNK